MNNIKLAENTLGQRIKAQRIRMGYTQEKLAELMCVSKLFFATPKYLKMQNAFPKVAAGNSSFLHVSPA